MLRTKLFAGLCLSLAFSLAFSHSASAELTTNGDFEAGDVSGWTSFPSASSTFAAIDNPLADVYDGTFSGSLDNTTPGSAAVIKQANLAVGTVQPGDLITISFWAKGAGTAGGVHFAEFFSELAGGGTSKNEILGSGPLPLTSDFSFFEFTTEAGPDVSGGVTLQFNAATGANIGSTSSMILDNVSVTLPAAVPEPASALVLGLGSLGLLLRRRRNS